MHKEIGRFRLVLVAIFSFLFSGILCLSSGAVHATTSTLTLNITDSLSVDLFATSSAGTFATSDTTTPNIFVKTNNGTGYTLGIKASSSSANNNKLINTTDNTKYFSSISASNFPSGISESDYSDDTYASSNNLNNTWGYRPSKLNSVNNSNYLPAPTDATDPIVLDQTTTANPSTNNEYNIAIGARANNTTAPGSYANTFIITAVANPSKYSITYNQNTTDTVTNMPANVSNQDTYGDTVNIDTTVPVRNGYNFKGWCSVQVADGASCTGATYNPNGGGTNLTWTIDQTVATNSLTIYAMWESAGPQLPCTAGKICYHAIVDDVIGQMGNQSASDNASVVLWASNFKRDGYGFAGWSDAYEYTTNPNAHFYGPMETITTPSNLSTNGLSLYAIWIPSAGSLQSDGASTCNSLTKAPAPGEATTANLSSVSALTDDRDGNTYAIAKLADNKCWTIENLRLADKDSNNNNINLSSTNTHNPSLPLTNSWYYENRQGTLTTSNHLSATSDPYSTNPNTAWCTSDSSDCDDQSMLATNNTTLFTSNTSSSYSTSSNVYSYGNYYNWYSATAGHGTYNKEDGNTNGDICPAGWHLPTGTSSGEFYALNTNVNAGSTSVSTGLRAYPANFLYPGFVRGSYVNYRSSFGYYWSSSAFYTFNAYFLALDSNRVTPGVGGGKKYLGSMVRCVVGV